MNKPLCREHLKYLSGTTGDCSVATQAVKGRQEGMRALWSDGTSQSIQGFGRLKETTSETSWDLRTCLPEFRVSLFDAVQFAHIRARLSVCLSVQQPNTNVRHLNYCSESTGLFGKDQI
jgi:hypothetical protein